ncbi:hypothetical protein Trydic_g2610 [Trypoxylus dichotomus]
MTEKPIQKMKKGMPYSAKEKQMIVNVFKYFRKLYPDKSVSEIVACTAEATGSSERSVYMFRKEDASVEGLKEPTRKRIRKNIVQKNGFDSIKEGIRSAIDTLKQNKIPSSFKFISQMIRENPLLPSLGNTTLRKLLIKMGYVYEKVGGESILVERGSCCQQGSDTIWINDQKGIIMESHRENLVFESNQPDIFIKCENEEQCSDTEFYDEEQYGDTELNNDVQWNVIDNEQDVILKFECDESWGEDGATNDCDNHI